jgi:hypothetical protein
MWQRIRETLQDWSLALARKIPSLGYAIIYLLVIIAFAIIYALMPHQFYHSTIQFEQPIRAAEEPLSAALTRDIKEDYRWFYSQKANPWGMGWRGPTNVTYDIEHLSVRIAPHPDALPNEISVELNAVVNQPVKGEAYDSVILPCWGELRIILTDPDTPNPYFDKQTPYDCVFEPTSAFVGADYLAHFFPEGFPSYPTQYNVGLSESTMRALEAYIEAMQGFPDSMSGNFWRMLYYSVTTMTTLGYGDICPITPAARFLSGFQSILGIVLVGLFINSIAFEANEAMMRRSKQQTSSAPNP